MSGFDLKRDVERGKHYLEQLHRRREILVNSISDAEPPSMLTRAALKELKGVNAAIAWLLQQTSLFADAKFG